VIWRELPPTAGLPIRWSDFLPRRGVPSLEEGLARFLDVPSVQIECSGTAALIVALECLKRRSSRRSVVVPAYTCPLVPLAIAHAGLEIRLCDTAPDRFDLDPDALRTACDRDTLCILPTHIGGAVTDLEVVLDVARRTGATIVEDAAQAFGARWHDRPVGTVGDIGFYSLARGKGLTLYEGGALVAADESMRAELSAASRRVVSGRRSAEACRLFQLAGYWLMYNPLGLRVVYGTPLRRALRRGDRVAAIGDEASEPIPLHRVSTLRKRIGAAALLRLGPWLRDSAARGRDRARRIGAIDGLEVITDARGGRGTWPFLMVLFRSAAACEQALGALWQSGLGVTRLFAHDLTGYRFLERIVPRTRVPNARSFAARCLTVSNSPWLTEEDFARVVEALAAAAASVRAESPAVRSR
jgi:dTDP-4-amino-4,6-dideoxygalactose transaminase